MSQDEFSFGQRVKNFFIGKGLRLGDPRIFHNMSLVAFFAWVGLGADGLSSSCYGPEEAFLTLGQHTFLAVFVALGTAVTIMIISASYSQIIDLFPSGGGGYLVASNLISPTVGMISGCALLIDYVLTITISIASGADAIFSSLPATLAPYKLETAVAGVLILTLLNLRGVKESVTVLVPIFMVFVISHMVALGYALGTHVSQGAELAARIGQDAGAARDQLGYLGMFLLILRAYTMGAGTYTGIEAVSNGLPILREPKARTGKRTMVYMAVSLAVTVMGLMLAYLLYGVTHEEGKTLNAVLFEAVTLHWPQPFGQWFVWVTLASEATLLFVAAQAGFLDGPRVLANMALDRWFPTRFAMLSDRLVTQNGILLMGASALALMLISKGAVDFLIVLYSINVFITFMLSQAGMVRHWWLVRHKAGEKWIKGLTLNGMGLALTAFILVSVVVVKFFEGGWLTVVITTALVIFALKIKSHYDFTWKQILTLDSLVDSVHIPACDLKHPEEPDLSAKTAVILVNGYNGLGLQTLFNVLNLHGEEFRNYVFVQVGVVDAHVMRDQAELSRLKQSIGASMDKYLALMRSKCLYGEAHWVVGTEVVHEIMGLAPVIKERFPRCVFFGGQLVFEKETFLTRLLHNHVVFSLQRQIYKYNIPFMIMPIAL
jgi:amino acid transporter